MLKKARKFLSSMRFALILLIVLAVVCLLGSLIPQGKSLAWYMQHYSERTASLIVGIRLDDVFHSWWFLAIALFLCLNLLLCNVLRFVSVLRRYRASGSPQTADGAPTAAQAEGIVDARPVFEKLRMPAPVSAEVNGRACLFSSKNRIGYWGAWICHLGILLLIAGFVLGQATHVEYTVYGVSGQAKQIGETDYALRIDDFRVELRENQTVSQYTANVTVFDLSDPDHVDGRFAEISVNHPASLYGFKLYQDSMGQAAKITVHSDGALRQEDYCCLGDAVYLLDTPVSLSLQSYLPDFEPGRSAYAYAIFVNDELVTQGVQLDGETIPYLAPYEVSFSEPQNYTLINIKRDSFTLLVLLGGVITLLGLFLSFYLQPKQLLAVQQPDGTWSVMGICPKGASLFRDQLLSACAAEDEAAPATS